jgi:hypothetical protein
MTWLGKARFFSATVAVVAVLAWITGTNHCLLEGQDAAVSKSHCPEHPKESGTGHDSPSGMLACCQGLLSPNFRSNQSKGSIFSNIGGDAALRHWLYHSTGSPQKRSPEHRV